MKVRRRFKYEGLELLIVTKEEPYLNSGRTVTVTRVIAPNNGVIPVRMERNKTLKSIIQDTILLLDGFKSRGCDVKNELTKTINNDD